MPTVSSSFDLKPVNFFESNPILRIPSNLEKDLPFCEPADSVWRSIPTSSLSGLQIWSSVFVKKVNTVPKVVDQRYDIFQIPVNTSVRFQIYRYFLLFYTIYKVIFLITQYITLATFYIFFMELLTFTTTLYMISCEGWKKLWVYVGSHFHHSQLLTSQIMTKIV